MQFITEYLIPLRADMVISKDSTVIENNIFNEIFKFYTEVNINSSSNFTQWNKKLNSLIPNSSFEEGLLFLAKGDYYKKGKYQDSLIVNNYENAYQIGLKEKSSYIINEALRKLCDYFFDEQNRIFELEETLFRFKQVEKDSYNIYYASFFETGLHMQQAYKKQITLDPIEINHLINIAKKSNNKKYLAETYQLAGAYHTLFTKNIDSSNFYFFKSKALFSEINDTHFIIKNKQIGLEINRAINLYESNNYQKAIQILDSLKSLPFSSELMQEKLSIHKYLASSYAAINQFQNAYIEKSTFSLFRDSINAITHRVAISDLRTKYKSEEKEKENVFLKKRQQLILIITVLLIILIISISFLLQKNTKRKQRIAEQESELQSQQLATVLKEQELTAIDAMIEGQEKERQRIANDLHDDLGGLMTNVKWHFDALKEKQSTELFDKTNTLLDEAYQKIRGIAHAKNSGVIAKQGLLKAVKHMAEKVSVLNKIQIEVVDHGLENRLENSLELTIFRIIQELTTNIIKHAQATEATIHITNHEESLNILVEDNGKGFNPSQITKTNKGMGINSIDKRVEYLEGIMTIESEPKQGTTIIIDIPLLN